MSIYDNINVDYKHNGNWYNGNIFNIIELCNNYKIYIIYDRKYNNIIRSIISSNKLCLDIQRIDIEASLQYAYIYKPIKLIYY